MIHRVSLLKSASLKVKIVVGVLAMIVLAGAAGAAYYWYAIYKAKNNQIFLSDSLSEYQQLMESKDPAWQDMVMMANLAQEQTTFAPYKPYLGVIKAQGYAQQGNITDAVTIMDEVLAEIPENSPYKTEYMLTRALMQLDEQDTSVQEQGLVQLQELAYTDNLFQDAAIYYLAHYYHVHNNQQALIKLLQQAQAFNLTDSPWISQLKQELALE